jgi:hypothetical protein
MDTAQERIRPGVVYLIYSCEEATPFMFAKVIDIVGESLKLKIHPDQLVDRPASYNPSVLHDAKCVSIPMDMFMAWGPPMFPIEFIEEEVTTEELNQEYV